MLCCECFDLWQIHIKKPLKISSGYKQVQLSALWKLVDFSDDTTIVVAPILKPSNLDALCDVFSRVSMSANSERLVEKRWQIFTLAAGQRHGLRRMM